jgi:hypothetical protein
MIVALVGEANAQKSTGNVREKATIDTYGPTKRLRKKT